MDAVAAALQNDWGRALKDFELISKVKFNAPSDLGPGAHTTARTGQGRGNLESDARPSSGAVVTMNNYADVNPRRMAKELSLEFA
jgi:hypothetical protein